MATNFFERQDRARRSTGRLVLLFVLAVIGIVGTTFLVAALVVAQIHSRPPVDLGRFPWEVPLLAAGAALAMIVGGSLFKVVELRAGGGAGVASRLGGHRVNSDTRDVQERRLLNVVEEMAIASGVPVPHVYLLEESGINAFAAGYAPGDAVLGVTRGAINQLSREELQGVIAHEFSHVLNGDMRLSIRLIGILHGILLLGLTGNLLLRSAAHGSRGRRDEGQAILVMMAIALCLMVLGFLGSFVGGLIKAAVSRQREYLADASAVQFTRNPHGIAGALKQIGAAVAGSRLKAPGAAEASHLFFAQGVWEGFSGLMATHPPLENRILALEPSWDGTFPRSRSVPATTTAGDGRAVGFAPASPEANINPELVDHAVQQVGDPREEHRQYAQGLIASLPPEVVEAVHEPFGARGVIYCLLLDPSSEVRQKQIELLRRHADPAVLALASKLQQPIAGLDPRARLPLVDLAIPALRDLSAGQYERFDLCVQHLVAADRSLSLFEWTLGRVLSRHLAPNFGAQRNPPLQYYALNRLGAPCSMLLSTIAHVGHNQAEAARAFETARGHLPEVELQFLSRHECGLPALQAALDTLATAAPKHRVRVVDACAEVICADGEVKLAEAELLRGIADLLDCPIPPLIAGQRVAAASPFSSAAGGAVRK